MKIVSFIPSATEIVYALGLGSRLIGVTHECDYPASAKRKPVVIESRIDSANLSNQEIDELVRQSLRKGEDLYKINEELLQKTEPDLIITQELCEVCAVSMNITKRALSKLKKKPAVIALDPKNLGDILEAIIVVGEATERAEKAKKIVGGLRRRINAVKEKTIKIRNKPRVFAMEWISPPYCGGHWIPEMVSIAGGIDVLGEENAPGRRVEWSEIARKDLEKIVLIPCGFGIKRTMQDVRELFENKEFLKTTAAKTGEVYATEANSYFSRSGPRIVVGLEILANILHPELFKINIPKNSFKKISVQLTPRIFS